VLVISRVATKLQSAYVLAKGGRMGIFVNAIALLVFGRST